MTNRKTLRRVMVLLDARHGIKPSDLDMIELLNTYVLPLFILKLCIFIHLYFKIQRKKEVSDSTHESGSSNTF